MESQIEAQSLFQLLALSLGNAALLALGYFDEPNQSAGSKANASKKVDLEAAKQNIELLEMLEAKTKGNLTQEEVQLLHALLFDLRLKYVEASKHA